MSVSLYGTSSVSSLHPATAGSPVSPATVKEIVGSVSQAIREAAAGLQPPLSTRVVREMEDYLHSDTEASTFFRLFDQETSQLNVAPQPGVPLGKQLLRTWAERIIDGLNRNGSYIPMSDTLDKIKVLLPDFDAESKHAAIVSLNQRRVLQSSLKKKKQNPSAAASSPSASRDRHVTWWDGKN